MKRATFRTSIIWKEVIDLEKGIEHKFLLPTNAKILHVEKIAPGKAGLWFEFDEVYMTPEHRKIHTFFVMGTGFPGINDSWEYHGTWLDLPHVWHLYESH